MSSEASFIARRTTLRAGNNPLSAITVGAMADLGYSVSYSAADPYTRSTALFHAH